MVSLQANNILKKGETLYFTSSKSSIIFSMDMIDWNIKLLTFVPEEDKYKESLFANFIGWKDCFVCIPYNAKNIWIADGNFSEWKKIELEYSDVKMKFQASVIVDNKLYLFKHAYPESLCVDLISGKIEVIRQLDDDFFVSAIAKENVIYIPSASRDILFQYDIFKKNVKKVNLNCHGNSFDYIYRDLNRFYLLSREGTVLLEIEDDDVISRIDLKHTRMLRNVFIHNRKIYIPSADKGKSLIYDGKKIEEWSVNEIACSKKLDDNMQALLDEKGNMYLFFKGESLCKKMELEILENEYHNLIEPKKIFAYKEVNFENSLRSLDDFIEFVK